MTERIAAYTNEAYTEDGKFFVGVSYANGGYVPMTDQDTNETVYFDTVEQARDFAELYNRMILGIDQDEALMIVAASMAAGMRDV